MDNQKVFFARNRGPRFTASAPFVLEIMGGTAAHVGSLVLQMPARQGIGVTVALRPDSLIRIRTDNRNPPFEIASAEIVSPQLAKPGIPEETPGAAACVVACLSALRRGKGIEISGADIFIDLQMPVGGGFDQPATLAMATFRALGLAYGLVFEGDELPDLVREVESTVAGPPRQPVAVLAVHFGQPGKILPILCQPAHVSDLFPVPEGLHFVVIGSGQDPASSHAHENARTAAFMGYTMLALHEGAYPYELQLARDTGQRDHLLYNGYLANITPRAFEDRYAWLPAQLKGRDFLDRYGFTIDPLAEVKPDETYDILQATRHPVHEHTRTQYFALLLQHLPPHTDPAMREKSLRQLGSWMRQSHESLVACGLGSPEADELVRLARENAGNGVYGASATGGGMVCLLCEGEQGLAAARAIREACQQKLGEPVGLFV